MLFRLPSLVWISSRFRPICTLHPGIVCRMVASSSVVISPFRSLSLAAFCVSFTSAIVLLLLCGLCLSAPWAVPGSVVVIYD